MGKINFKKFPVYKSIRRDETEEVDISEVLANTIYTTRGGVVAHSLAMRIYEQGEVELRDKDKEIILHTADVFVGVLADSIKELLKTI
jgi:hypothetical protein